MNKWLRRKRNSLGYGIQSPSDFYFLHHVLHEDLPYYGYADLKEITREHSTFLPHYSETTNKLLYRLTNHIHPDTMIELGAGLSVLAMTLSCPSGKCTAITSSSTHCEAIRYLLVNSPQAEVKQGNEMELLCHSLQEFGTIDMLHIAHTTYYKEAINAALPYVSDRTLIVIEGIRTDKGKHEWWRNLLENRQTGITYDLGETGLLFFDQSRHKNTYWITLKDQR